MDWLENLGEIFHDHVLSNGEFTWTFPNLFFNYDGDGFVSPSIASPWFCFEGERFRVALMPNGGSFGLFVWQNNPRSREKPFQMDIFFRTTECTSWDDYDWLEQEEHSYHKRWLANQNGTWEFNEMEIFSDFRSISPQGKVTISLKMSALTDLEGLDGISEKCVCSRKESVSPVEGLSIGNNKKSAVTGAKGVERLQQNFMQLFQDGHNSDVILKVDGREFATHRCILGVRSPVFAGMFDQDMAEKNSDVIDIPDCSSEAFEVFLRYLYTGSASGAIWSEIVFNLYYAADEYQVHDLKEDCVEFMKKTLSVSTFCDIISLALRHSESGLLKLATDFFRDNVRTIIKTVQWQSYIQQNPVQANELYIEALNG